MITAYDYNLRIAAVTNARRQRESLAVYHTQIEYLLLSIRLVPRAFSQTPQRIRLYRASNYPTTIDELQEGL